MSLISALRQIERGLPVTHAPELASAVHWTPAENLPVHRWFRYREGFSPYLLEHFAGAKYRLDPFCGCGTTLVESAMRKTFSYGIDLNPLATFITRTKTKRYTSADRNLFLDFAYTALREYRNLHPAPLPKFDLLQKVFLPESLDRLQRLKSFVASTQSKRISDLLFLAWLSILEDSSNVFKEGNGLKYRNKRRKPGKYVTLPENEWVRKHFGGSITIFIENLWLRKCEQIADDIRDFRVPDGYIPKVKTGSCLDPGILDFDAPIDLAVFSPPYANRFDYFEAFKIELWMGDFARDGKDMASLRQGSIRNNLAARKYSGETVWPDISPFLDCMDDSASSVRMGIKPALQGYFHDMRTLLRNLKAILRKQGKVAIVVGNSAYAKSIIPTDALIARIALEEGYRINAIKIARPLHVSSQQRRQLSHLAEFMRESVIVLEKQ